MIFEVKYGARVTMGATVHVFHFTAGRVEGSSVDYCKAQAANLVKNRKVEHLVGASIVDGNGKEVAVINQDAYDKRGVVEWVTIR